MNQGHFDAIMRRLDRIIDLLKARPLSPEELAAAKVAMQVLQGGEDGTELPQSVSRSPKTKRTSA